MTSADDEILRLRHERLMKMSEKLLYMMDYADSQVESWLISQFLRSDIPSRIYNFFKSLPLTKAELDFPSEINNFFTMPPTIEEHMS
ncbi:hypothetical protein ISN45_At03g054610 [Arabidopsis thaliana x Arabidopsis arenosa]|uniref:Uncharacterized protein n=1 Tax=Arabidopsis thaliana x Arabidopsis arenosa TaxID=1240361 RepID=A0A8T2F3Y3_9BRAS|nr:hypothetical protein ISN45_At03g054610 [Arabidopsis thaliana x Arabidopsis arenosa]